MSGERHVKAHAGIATGTGAATDTPTRIMGVVKGFGPKRLDALMLSSGGRRSKRGTRIAAIVDAAAEMGPDATRDRVAQALNRADEDDKPQSDYKRDVRLAGGWSAILRRAREL